jgi:hypothetical protein
MADLTVKIKDVDKLTAYKIVNHLSFEYDVLEANYGASRQVFSKEDKTKLHRHFLKENFGEKSLLKKYGI